jgi:ABC-type dipeptide/oligopeptide/nickel transport system permease subunit
MMKKVLHNKQAVLGLFIILVFAIIAIFAPVLAPHDPGAANVLIKFQAPSLEYPLGTDELGRCILSRLLYGTRYSLGIAVPIVLIIFCVSLVLGTLSAYYGGIVDCVFIVLCDIVMAFPPIVIILALIGGLGQSLINLFIALVLTMWAWYSKIVRSYVLQEKNKDYITAAKVYESSDSKIMLRHIIPNIIPILLVNFTISIGGVVIMISGFSYLGLGVGTGVPEWGSMLSNAKQYIYSYPQFILYPGVCILLCVAGFNLLGEALRDIVMPEDKV